MKFSAFMGQEKEYQIDADPMGKFQDKSEFKKLEQKEEFSKIPFDPEVRLRLPEMPNHLAWRFFEGYEPKIEPQSIYVAVNH
jgi:hypothetical protein